MKNYHQKQLNNNSLNQNNYHNYHQQQNQSKLPMNQPMELIKPNYGQQEAPLSDEEFLIYYKNKYPEE